MSTKRNIWNLVAGMYVLLMLSSCNLLKNVPPDDKLYTGMKLNVTHGKLDKNIRSGLKELEKPKPNASFLGVKYRLVLYNMIKEPKKKKGLFYNMKHKWGEAPVLLSQVRPVATAKRMEDELFSLGYLRPAIGNQANIKSRKAVVMYNIDPGSRYTMRNIEWPTDSSEISKLMRRSSRRTLLKKNNYINVDIFEAERERIDQMLKQNGYYFFAPDNLLFRVDTLHHDSADVYITLKDDVRLKGKSAWKIGEITVYGNYTIERDSLLTTQKGELYKGLHIVDNRKTFDFDLYRRVIVMNQGEMYRRTQHSLTIERMMNLGNIKFVKMSFDPNKDSTLLNTFIYVTPAKRRSLRLELGLNTKSNNFVGSEISLNYKNVNLFKAAEILEAKVNFGFDSQVGGEQINADAFSLTGEINLRIPKVLVPFKTGALNGSYLPRTIFSTKAEFIRRPDLYTLRSGSFSFGYFWKKGRNMEHDLRLVNINSVETRNVTAKFDSMLAEDVTLRAAFEKQLIIGTKYQFKFNNTYRVRNKFNYALTGTTGTAGNLATLFRQVAVDTPGAKQLFGIPLSQFVRFEADLRGYYKINRDLVWANRIIAGVALGYGNSVTVPYAEQFFIGGSSSLRAFRARTLGPGSFYSQEKYFEANQSGEIKVELNTEVRYSLSKLFKLAFFTDAGNIWLRKDAIDKPGSGLGRGELFKEMAVGMGFGLRIDVKFLLVRFDFALPVRKPWLPEHERWVFDKIDLGNTQWRKDNIILNIGIGYPF